MGFIATLRNSSLDWSEDCKQSCGPTSPLDRPIGGGANSAWKSQTDTPTKVVRKSAHGIAVPTDSFDTRRDRSGPTRPSTPHVVRRDGSGPTRNTPVPSRNDPERPSQPIPAAPVVRTLPHAGAPGRPTPPTLAPPPDIDPATSGARTALRMSASELVDQVEAPAVEGGSAVKTKVEPAKTADASNFLLAVLVLIAAGGAAAMVYFALPT